MNMMRRRMRKGKKMEVRHCPSPSNSSPVIAPVENPFTQGSGWLSVCRVVQIELDYRTPIVGRCCWRLF